MTFKLLGESVLVTSLEFVRVGLDLKELLEITKNLIILLLYCSKKRKEGLVGQWRWKESGSPRGTIILQIFPSSDNKSSYSPYYEPCSDTYSMMLPTNTPPNDPIRAELFAFR